MSSESDFLFGIRLPPCLPLFDSSDSPPRFAGVANTLSEV